MNYVYVILFWAIGATSLWAETITLASTTSTQNSGLYDYLLPLIEEDTGIQVRVVAVGTGQALRIARNGDADLLLVHHRPSEVAFIQDGFGIKRFDLMYNDYVIVGPENDPAGISNAPSLKFVYSKLAQGRAPFISRGDDSGTHKRELMLWEQYSEIPMNDWYREIGSGMGATLNMAAAVGAYTLTDRGTWISFGNKQNLEILYEADPALFNPYGLILLNPEKFPHLKFDAAQQVADWLISPVGQEAIGAFRSNDAQLFCPNAQEITIEACPAQSLRK